jgi:hypothetical protein
LPEIAETDFADFLVETGASRAPAWLGALWSSVL